MGSTTRATLARAVARRVGVGQTEARAQVACVVSTLFEALVRGESVKLRDIGSLQVQWRSPRRVMHPRLGCAIEVGRRPRVVFRASAGLPTRTSHPIPEPRG